jgi:hypothetical protein
MKQEKRDEIGEPLTNEKAISIGLDCYDFAMSDVYLAVRLLKQKVGKEIAIECFPVFKHSLEG